MLRIFFFIKNKLTLPQVTEHGDHELQFNFPQQLGIKHDFLSTLLAPPHTAFCEV